MFVKKVQGYQILYDRKVKRFKEISQKIGQ